MRGTRTTLESVSQLHNLRTQAPFDLLGQQERSDYAGGEFEDDLDGRVNWVRPFLWSFHCEDLCNVT